MMNPDGDIYLTLVQPGSVYWQAGNKHQGWALIEHNKPLTRLHGPIKVKIISGVLKVVERKDGETFTYFGNAAKKVASEWPPASPDRTQGIEYELELVGLKKPVVTRLWAHTNGLKNLGLIVGDEVVIGWKRKPLPKGACNENRSTFLSPVAWGVPEFPPAGPALPPGKRDDPDMIDETFDRR